MVNNATDIHNIVLVPVPSQYLDFQRYMSWSLLWSVILRWEVIVCCVDIDGIVDHHGFNLQFIIASHRIVEYKKDHWLNIFMFCKLQHGKIEGIWYLQTNKSWQVAECVCLDWCDRITVQKTAKYKIRTKYKGNLRTNNYKESRKTTFVQLEPTYLRTKVKQRTNKRQTKVNIRKLKLEQQEAHYNWSWTLKLNIVNKIMFHKWHTCWCWRQ